MSLINFNGITSKSELSTTGLNSAKNVNLEQSLDIFTTKKQNIEQDKNIPKASDGVIAHKKTINNLERSIGFDSKNFMCTASVINKDGSLTETYYPLNEEDSNKIIVVTTSADKSTKTVKYQQKSSDGDNKFNDVASYKVFPQYIFGNYSWGIKIDDNVNDVHQITN